MNITKTHILHEHKHASPLISCRFNPSGEHVFVGSQDYSVHRIEVASGTKVTYPTDAWVRAITFPDGGDSVITGGYDGRLMWWPVRSEKPEPTRVIEAHSGWIRSIAVSPNGKLLVSVGNDLLVQVRSMEDGSLVRQISGHESHIYNAAFHPSGDRLATGDLYGNVFDWEVESGKQVRTWKAESLTKFDKTFVAQIGGFRGMKFTADGSELLCSGITNVSNAFAGIGNPSVVSFDWEAGKQKIEHLSKGSIRGVAWGVVALSDGTRIAATGGSGGHLLFWKPGEEKEFHNVKLKDVARDLAVSDDERLLATPHFNGQLSIHLMDEKQ